MKKILFFIESLSGGGAEKVLAELVNRFNKNKFDITVITVVDVGIYRNEIKKNCKYISILPNPEKLKTMKLLIYKLRYKLIYLLPPSFFYKFFIKEKYDLEVAFVEGFATKIISKSTNTLSKKVAWVHVDPINRGYADRYFRNLRDQIESYKKYDKVVCVSKKVKNSFEEKVYKDKKVIVKYNPVDSKAIIYKSNEKCERTKPDKFLIGTIGRLTRQKGYDRLLKIMKILKDDGLNCELWVLGEGQDRPRLEQYINDNNLSDSVKLIGFKSNPYKYIAMCDLFVCSSRAEGFSLALAEAMVLGLPTISTECAGPNELLNSGEYGMVVKNNDLSLYEGIKTLINDKALLARYKAKSLERSNIFTISTAIKDIEKVFN
ncbi:glycosyltransferase [Sediminibacillus massiliensis]|uniref:glycosyltransferase n=1 Tax=Sediminibacillus massiliensis TaxID=1926277 RepID=UPI0015C2E2E7|nr:glycosyltransferase [Sediminibacillus massiliensis]